MLLKNLNRMFSRNIYVARRQRLIKSVKDGILLFLGNSEAPSNYADNHQIGRAHV